MKTRVGKLLLTVIHDPEVATATDDADDDSSSCTNRTTFRRCKKSHINTPKHQYE